jgi:hyperosmotically inducible protein
MIRKTVLAVLLLASGWIAQPASAAQATLDKDAKLALFNAVQKQVLGYPQFTIFDSVQARISDTGVVELTGKVTMPYKRDAIEKRVAKLAGVTAVRDKIDVLPVSRFDDDLRVRIARAIYGNSYFWGYGSRVNPPIHIIVEHGRVTLDGVVNSDVDRMMARSIASSFLSFGAVQNDLKTEAEAREELEQL